MLNGKKNVEKVTTSFLRPNTITRRATVVGSEDKQTHLANYVSSH